MEDYITRQEHKEFSDRLEAEDKRQNHRLDILEDSVREISGITMEIHGLSIRMENMLEELKKQGERLEALEKEPAETSKQVKQAIITAVVGAVVGAVVTAIIMIL